MREQCGWQGQLLPKSSTQFHSLCEVLFDHQMPKAMVANSRAKFSKAVVTVDGQWSSMLSVLYQHRHGQAGPREANQWTPNKHVAISVR